MRLFYALLLTVLSLGILKAQLNATPQVAGVIATKPVAGYPAITSKFVSIQWVNNNGGFITDEAGTKTPFLNDGIGKIIYFDQPYYESIDHNQYWLNYRAGVQVREVVVTPVDSFSLSPEDINRLQGKLDALTDMLNRFPSSGGLIGATITTLRDDIDKLKGGLVMRNGTWVSAKDAGAAPSSVPVVGEGVKTVTFTTRDGKQYVNAQVIPNDKGVSVVTASGGASVSYDQIPQDLSPFPEPIRSQIKAGIARMHPLPVAPPPTPAPPKPEGFVDTFTAFVTNTSHVLNRYFSQAYDAVSSSAPPPPPAPTGPAVPDLSIDAVVLIKGDNGQGTGFLTKTANGPVVITNLHVLAENPNLKILTSKGEQIIPTGLKAASDRDLAMFTIEDKGYTYLELASSVESSAAAGDPTVIPGNSEGGEVTLKTNGKVVAIGPGRVEFDNPIFHGNSGGPVYDVKSKKVIAVVVGASKMRPQDDLDKSSFANSNSAIKGNWRYFGLRIDTVPAWENYDQGGFLQQTLFLKEFHEQSRALDSFINGTGYEHANIASEEGAPDSKYFYQNDKVRKVADNFRRTRETRDEQSALQELVWALESLVGDGYDSIQSESAFYPFNRTRAKREFDYRKALKDELEDLRGRVKSPGARI